MVENIITQIWPLLQPLLEQLGDILSPLTGIFDGGMQCSNAVADLIDDHLIRLSDRLSDFGQGKAVNATGIARALGAVFILIVAAGQAYKMMTKGEGLDVLQLGRPILIALILSQWNSVVNIVKYPGEQIEAGMKEVYIAAAKESTTLRERRSELSQDVYKQISANKADELENQLEKAEWWDVIEKAGIYIKHYADKASDWMATRFMTGLAYYIQYGVQMIGEVVFQVAVYIIFLIKALFITALTMFGPIQFAASILPVWKDAWQTWVGKMVSVSLYGACAYLAMAFSMVMIHYALEADIGKLTTLTTNPGDVWAYAGGALGSALTTAIAYFVGAFAFTTVPEMSTWAIPSQTTMAAGGFISSMAGRAKYYSGTSKVF